MDLNVGDFVLFYFNSCATDVDLRTQIVCAHFMEIWNEAPALVCE